MSKLGDNLKKYRLKCDMSQEEVAEVIHKSNRTYSRYETGTLMPDVETLIELAELFQVPLDLLVGRVTSKEDFWYRIVPLIGLGDLAGAVLNRKRATNRRKKKAATTDGGTKSGS